MEYIIATGDTPSELESEVAGLIANNWIPIGGVFANTIGIISLNVRTTWAQAMTREDKEGK